MKVRLIKEVGTRAWLRTFVFPAVDSCPDAPNGRHEALNYLTESSSLRDQWLGGEPSDYPPFAFPTHCDSCGVDMARLEPEYAIFHRRRYDTESGLAGPGDMFYADWFHCQFLKRCMYGWKNCTSPHLLVTLPTRRYWDIDGRAMNCNQKTDRHHRCWIRHGTLPDITVGKTGGPTCSIGDGSVIVGSWQGGLINGELKTYEKLP